MSTIKSDNFEGTVPGNNLIFKTNSTERMRISASTGNVGIGTNSPSVLLHVNGTVKNTNPSFMASSAVSRASAGTITWNTELLDTASAFNPGTGTFTAPIGGVYCFNGNILGYWGGASPRTVTYWAFQRNAVGYGTNHFSPNSSTTAGTYTTITGSVVISLSANDTVSMYLSGGEVYAGYGSFSGYLIG